MRPVTSVTLQKGAGGGGCGGEPFLCTYPHTNTHAHITSGVPEPIHQGLIVGVLSTSCPGPVGLDPGTGVSGLPASLS